MVESLSANAGDGRDSDSIPGWGRSPGGGHATHSNILAWRILWTEGPGGLQSMGSQSWTRLSRRALTRGEAELPFSSLTWGSQGVPTT